MTSASIIRILRNSNVFVESNLRWNNEEINILIDIYSNNDWNYIFEELPRFNKIQIVQKAHKLKLTKEDYFWNDNDVNILKSEYKNGATLESIYKKLNSKFSLSAIHSKAVKLNITNNNEWTKRELEILNQLYNNLSINDILLLIPNRERGSILKKAKLLGLDSGRFYTNEDVEYIKNNWENKSDFELSKYLNRSIYGIKRIRLKFNLLRVNKILGYDYLSQYIKGRNGDWKVKSMKKCGYKCIISGQRFDDIHHLYGANLILKETLSTLNLPIHDDINTYTSEELLNILKTYKNIQSRYPFGVCMAKKYHKLFHDIYGYGNNTIEQFEDFINNFENKDRLITYLK